jgi:hypothetical protein
VLESLLRNNDGLKVTDKDVRNLANYNAKAPGDYEIPFVVARIVLQDFTGVPLLVDLAAMRSAVHAMGKDAKMIEPLVPVDLVVDHSVQVDYAGTGDSLRTATRPRIPPQPRALRVPQMGRTGLRYLQGRASRHRHRPPGEPRIPRQVRAGKRRRLSIPTPSSAPTRTPP